MLSIRNLSATVDATRILNGVDLQINAGEVHAIMGPNGAGKSTLGQVLAGREGYTVTGDVTYDGADLLVLTPEARAAAGLFLAFQYPVEIPGVGNMYFLRTAVNAVRLARGLPEHGAVDFLALAKEHMARLDMDPSLLSRSVNAGFSGGEKKRNEILQMSMLEPRLAILTRPTPVSTSTRCASSPKECRRSAAPIGPSSSSRTTRGCSGTSFRIRYTCSAGDGSFAPVTADSRSSSKLRDTGRPSPGNRAAQPPRRFLSMLSQRHDDTVAPGASRTLRATPRR